MSLLEDLQEDNHDERRRSDRWHVGKEIPLAIIFAITVQTMGGIWFAATYVAKIDTLTSLMSEFKATQYTQADAARDKESYSARANDLTRRVERLEGGEAWARKGL